MKLELVMLTTVISMITERQVEAQLRCYDNRNFNGVEVKLGTNPNIAKQFPNGPKACKVPANTTLILYSKPNYLGEVNTFHSGDDEEDLFTRHSFIARSLLILGNQLHQEGIFLFQWENFQGGLSQHFSKEIEKVRGNITFGSVVVIGSLHWTVARSCHASDCQRKCLICLQPSNSRASFYSSIDSTGMWETKTILPGACLGKKYTGVSEFPDCPCNQYGAVDGPNKCINYQLKDDCDLCQPSHAYRNGKCVACGCDTNGVFEKRQCLIPGICICKPEWEGRNCSFPTISTFKDSPHYQNLVATIKYFPGKITSREKKFFVDCHGRCGVHSVKTFDGPGRNILLILSRYIEPSSIYKRWMYCWKRGTYSTRPDVHCDLGRGDYYNMGGRKSFYMSVKATGPTLRDVTFRVVLGNNSYATITDYVSPRRNIRKDKSGNEYLKMKSGSKEIKGLNYEHIRVECSGKCKGIKFSSGGGKGDVKLFGAEEEPAFIHQNACINNCICESNDPGNADVCKLPDGKRKFDLKSKFFWIHLAPNPSFENVDIQVTGDNIVKAYKHENIAKQHLKLTDGSLVLALSPTKRGQYKHMGVYSFSNITNVKFQIFGAGKSDFEIRAGKTTKMDGNGVCNECDCQGPCDTGFDTRSQRMYVTFKALRDIDGVVYVKLFGSNIASFVSYYFLSPTTDSI